MTDLVVVSLEDWDEVWRRNQHLVAGLLREDPGLRVLFVEPAADPLHAARACRPSRPGKGLRPGPSLAGVEPGRLWLYQPTKWLPRRIDPSSDRRWARSVVRAAGRVRLDRPVLWVNSTSGAHVLERTGWPALYDITDDWLSADRTEADHRRLVEEEAYLLAHCDEVVVCSPSLQASKRAARVTLIRNAVDLDAYRRTHRRPDDLPEGLVALYVGTLHEDRLDVALCEATARALRDDGRLVLVGPDLLPERQQDRLVEAGTVILGQRDHSVVPAYLQHADVLVVPHLVNAFTDSLDPIKVYEYAAAGRPVVSTPVAGFRDCDDPLVTVAEGPELAQIVRRRMLSPPSASPPGPRPGVPSWADRVREIQDVLRRVGERRPRW